MRRWFKASGSNAAAAAAEVREREKLEVRRTEGFENGRITTGLGFI